MHVYIRKREKFGTFLQKGIALLRKTEDLKGERGKKKYMRKAFQRSVLCNGSSSGSKLFLENLP